MVITVSNPSENRQTRRVSYVCGSFDLYHAGTAAFLESVKEFTDYLIVGVFSSESLQHVLGPKFPLLTLEQRAMCVSACKYVDEILLNAPLNTSRVSSFFFFFAALFRSSSNH